MSLDFRFSGCPLYSLALKSVSEKWLISPASLLESSCTRAKSLLSTFFRRAFSRSTASMALSISQPTERISSGSSLPDLYHGSAAFGGNCAQSRSVCQRASTGTQNTFFSV
ncbi:hypothetical protein D3C71_1682400 [compost metagenome]